MKSITFAKALTAVLLITVAAGRATAQEAPQNDGSKEGADIKNNDLASDQDKKDMVGNAEAVNEGLLGINGNPQEPKTAEANETGGKGGVDPATGETLLPLPAASDFCKSSGQSLADGTQQKDGSCSSLPQGQIPSSDKMVSTLIVEPANLAKIELGTEFTVSVVTANLKTGFFDAAQTEYYTQPQTLDDQGIVKGHQHITIQKIADKNRPPNANDKQFFKGLNDKADGSGKLSVAVPADALKEPGLYRICSMTGTFAHQPVVMPVAQRGSQDDCIRVDVVAGAGNGVNNGGNGDNNGGNGGNNGGNGGNNGGNGGNNGGNDGNADGGNNNNNGNGDDQDGGNDQDGDNDQDGGNDANDQGGNNDNGNNGPQRSAVTQENPPSNNVPPPRRAGGGNGGNRGREATKQGTPPRAAVTAGTPGGRTVADIIAEMKADLAELEALVL